MTTRHTNAIVRAANPPLASEAAAICGDVVRVAALIFVAVITEALFVAGPVIYAVFGKRK